MRRSRAALLAMSILAHFAIAQDSPIKGHIVNLQGNGCPAATIQFLKGAELVAHARSDADGRFSLVLPSAGEFTVKVEAPGLPHRHQAFYRAQKRKSGHYDHHGETGIEI
jgi:Carboxypeptidase regulatory-like domain